MTVVMVDAHDHYPWQSSQALQVNEHTNSYIVGNERFLNCLRQFPIRKFLLRIFVDCWATGMPSSSLWNGLTTIVQPYKDREGTEAARICELFWRASSIAGASEGIVQIHRIRVAATRVL